MRATILHSSGDIRLEQVPDPVLRTDHDAIVRTVASCICGSDLWPYRGIQPVVEPRRIGHEFVGMVEQVGAAVQTVRPGDFVIASFTFQDNTCEVCRNGVQSACLHGGFWGNPDRDGHFTDGCQGEAVRVPLADGTLVKTPGLPDEAMLPHVLSLADVFPTGHHAAISAGVGVGRSVVVVGDGAVGLSAVLAAKRLGAGPIIAMSRHADRQAMAREFGATQVVAERGKEGADIIREMLNGIGADCVLECVGTGESMKQAMLSVRPGGKVGYVGVPHGVELNVPAMFGRNIGLAGGAAPVRAYLDELLPDVWSGAFEPGNVFDLTLPLDQVAEGYAAMDQRRSIKTMLLP